LQIFLAGMDSAAMKLDNIIKKIPDGYIKYGLLSYYYLRDEQHLINIKRKVQNILVDSGAFTFQRGKGADLEAYTRGYARFIKENKDDPQFVGFFEMDVDVITGYGKVLEMRKRLERESDKIIPVWHTNRGVQDFLDMCEQYKGRRVSFSCIGDRDIQEKQYNLFINAAHKAGCQIHMLGMTRFSLLRELNLNAKDSVDSSSWLQQGIYATVTFPTPSMDVVSFDSLQRLDKAFGPSLAINLHTYRTMQLAYEDIDNSVYMKGSE